MRSRGLFAFQMFRSPTCGPLGVVRRQMCPAGTTQAWPEHGRIVKDSLGARAEGSDAVLEIAWYNGDVAWIPESEGAV